MCSRTRSKLFCLRNVSFCVIALFVIFLERICVMGKMSPEVLKSASHKQCCGEQQFIEEWKIDSVLDNNKIRTPVFFLDGVHFTLRMKAKIKDVHVIKIPVHFYCSLYIPVTCSL